MTKRKRGRPSNKEIAAKKPGGRGKVGRPAGDAAIINEYKARMLASPKSVAVLEKIFDAAMDDEHKGQQAAWKIITDRIVPAGYFEKDKTTGGKGGISINISGIGGGVNINEEEAEDAEFSDIPTIATVSEDRGESPVVGGED